EYTITVRLDWTRVSAAYRRAMRLPPFDTRGFAALLRANGLVQSVGLRRRLATSAFGCSAVRTLPIEHVIAGERHGILAFGDLHLEHHLVPIAERHLAALQIELPHAAEPLVIDLRHARAVRLEAVVPVLQRVGVMQPQDLDVGDVQAGALHRR